MSDLDFCKTRLEEIVDHTASLAKLLVKVQEFVAHRMPEEAAGLRRSQGMGRNRVDQAGRSDSRWRVFDRNCTISQDRPQNIDASDRDP